MTRFQAQLGPKKNSGVMHNKAIIFDLDMTLVDSSEAESDRNSGNWPETYELIPEFPLADGFDVLFDAIKTNGIRHCVVPYFRIIGHLSTDYLIVCRRSHAPFELGL